MYRRFGEVLARELTFSVPLKATSALPEIIVTARELRHDISSTKPYLVYLQGGPGFPASPVQLGALPSWVPRALKDYRVLLLDQRGTERDSL